MQTYLFYDLETSGLNKTFDQILQFAAIRTDLSFNELDRHEFKIKLNPDVIPSPYALITNRIPIAKLNEGMSEFEAIKCIHRLLNEPGTISLGYNTLGFDDEFLRFSFYRNLLPPYTHQYANQCMRMDIYPISILYFLYHKSVLNWPTKNAKISFKLEDLNDANGLFAGRAHDAMADVEMTLQLAKRLAREKNIWQYAHSYFLKHPDEDRIHQIENDWAILIDGTFGHGNLFQSIVYPLGFHKQYPKESLWLRLDQDDFTLFPENIDFGLTYEQKKIAGIVSPSVKRKKIAEPGFILPLKERFLQQLSPQRIALAEKNKRWLQTNKNTLVTITDHYRHYTYPIFPNADAQTRLYMDGFWSDAENTFCRLFHRTQDSEKSILVEKYSHLKITPLAIRILGKFFPAWMNDKQREEFNSYLQTFYSPSPNFSIDFTGNKRYDATDAIKDIETIKSTHTLDPQQSQLLLDYERYLNHRVHPA